MEINKCLQRNFVFLFFPDQFFEFCFDPQCQSNGHWSTCTGCIVIMVENEHPKSKVFEYFSVKISYFEEHIHVVYDVTSLLLL